MEGTHCARCGKKFDDPEEAISTILLGESRLQLTCWDDRTCYMEEMFLADFVSKKTRKVGDIISGSPYFREVRVCIDGFGDYAG